MGLGSSRCCFRHASFRRGFPARGRGCRSDRLSHQQYWDGRPTGVVRHLLDRRVTGGPVQRLAGPCRDQFEPPKSFPQRGCFAQVEDQAADPPSHEVRMGVHGTDARSIGSWFEEGSVSALRMIAAIHGRPTAPSSAAGNEPGTLDNEVGAIVDKLSIEPHDRPARCDLGGVQEGTLVLFDRGLYEGGKLRDVSSCCEPVAKFGAQERFPPA